MPLRRLRICMLYLLTVGIAACGEQEAENRLLKSSQLSMPQKFIAFGVEVESQALTSKLDVNDELVIRQGEVLYQMYCLGCHGSELDGNGHYAQALNPRPSDFTKEEVRRRSSNQWLYWRIAKGGGELPASVAPLSTDMPGWDNSLLEDEVWSLVAYLRHELSGRNRGGDLPRDDGRNLYIRYCASCHGDDGRGDGPASRTMDPKPRDFWLGVFKYKSTPARVPFPSDDDLARIIKRGVPGTAMPAWADKLTDQQIERLVHQIKVFGEWDGEAGEQVTVYLGDVGEIGPQASTRGQELYASNCEQCHGLAGRGNITSGKRLKDDLEDRIWPRNLTRPDTWRYVEDSQDLFRMISVGMPGTPMPQHTKSVRTIDRWTLTRHVMALRSEGEVLRYASELAPSRFIPIPEVSNTPNWESAPMQLIQFAPSAARAKSGVRLLNETASVQSVVSDERLFVRLAIDDRTFSVPGSELERLYALDESRGSVDAISVRFADTTKESVRSVFWQAASVRPEVPERMSLQVLDRQRSVTEEVALPGNFSLAATWEDGRWLLDVSMPLSWVHGEQNGGKDRQIFVQFVNWDGLIGDSGNLHGLSGWWPLNLP